MGHVRLWELDLKEGRRIDAFKLWYWRRLLKVPSTAGRSNQSISREINPEYSLEGLILKLKLQYFRHLIRIYDSLEKSLMLGKIEGRRRRGHWRMRWLNSTINVMNANKGTCMWRLTLGDGEGQGALACCSAWGHKELDTTGRLNKGNDNFVRNTEYIWKHFRWQLSLTLTVVDGPARWAKKWATRQVILSSYKQRSTFILNYN